MSDDRPDVSHDHVEALAKQLRGRLISPNDEDYERLRSLWNGVIDRRPKLIARCAGAADVIQCIRFSTAHGVPISIRGGGHNVAGNAILDDALVVDLSAMRSVRVDPATRRASAGAGATLGDIDHETAAFGLTTPLGLVSATGASGLTLHGGLGWLSRKHGLSLDNLMEVDIVTADGELRRANTTDHADLFWAVRGGGGNFGVVTRLEYALHSIEPQVWFAAVFYPLSKAAEGLRFFRKFMASAPEELGALGVLWSAPDEPFISAASRGAPVLVFLACYSGPFDQGEQAIAPLREFDTPLADLSGPMPFVEVQRFLDADYPSGRHYYWKSIYLDELSDDAIAALVKRTESRPSPLTSIDVWALGGAISRVPADTTAFGQREAPILIGIESNWDDFSQDQENIDWARAVFDDMKSFSSRGTYLNFPGFGEEGDQQIETAYGANYARLRSVKAKYDPNNLFRGNLNIRPAS